MSKTESKISIIVPVYNVEQYIPECVESIIQQTYKNVQIILVDDGSKDRSGEICDYYAETDKRIEVIHQTNGGLVCARKKGLERAEGDYIGFVDGDDYIAPDMYITLLEGLQKSDADFIHSGFIMDGIKNKPFEEGVIEFFRDDERESFIRKAVFDVGRYMTPSIWSKLFKAEFIKKSYREVPDNAQYGEDLINLCICIENCNKLALLDGAYYYYRKREDSITRERNIRGMTNIFQCYENVCNVIKKYKCYEDLKKSLEEDTYEQILDKVCAIYDNEFQIARYYFPWPDRLQGKKVVIYGAGAVGRDYYAQISRYTNCDVVAWVDTRPDQYDYPYIKLSGTEVLDQIVFDILLIAVNSEQLANEIGNQLMHRGVEKNKIIWFEARRYELNL